MKQRFRKIKLSKSNIQKLYYINDIIDEYSDDGYVLTLRQLYYQLVSRDVIPNKQSEYSKLSKLLKEGRMAGIVDWEAIEDRLRVPYLPYYNHSPNEALEDAVSHYRLNRQQGQETYLEVWVEKDALSGVLKRITNKYHVNLLVNRGYGSVTAIHDAYERINKVISAGKTAKLLYLGDHDPSGIDMVRDIRDRVTEMLVKSKNFKHLFEKSEDLQDKLNWWKNYLKEYIEKEKPVNDIDIDEWTYSCAYSDFVDNLVKQKFIIEAIGLTMEQIKTYNPPENPAKLTDPRAKWYVEKYGYKSWEVDALSPQTLNELLSSKIEENIDIEMFNSMLKQEKKDKEILVELKNNL